MLVVDVITIFPGMLDGFIRESMLKRAVEKGLVSLNTVNLRDFTDDLHRTTDDRPYGGGPGMVMLAEPLFKAVESLRKPDSKILLMTPGGRKLTQAIAGEYAKPSHIIVICGHYEGVDERVREALVTDEISIGDYVLTNGVLAAAVFVDAVVRLIPGVLGGEGAADAESFSDGMLEAPHYTRPAEFRGMTVPEVLMSGNHGAIAEWRKQKAEDLTRIRRPDLIKEKGAGKSAAPEMNERGEK